MATGKAGRYGHGDGSIWSSHFTSIHFGRGAPSSNLTHVRFRIASTDQEPSHPTALAISSINGRSRRRSAGSRFHCPMTSASKSRR
eukprot:scaffold301244_cov32-Tisochrysis_lutea.AAC.1